MVLTNVGLTFAMTKVGPGSADAGFTVMSIGSSGTAPVATQTDLLARHTTGFTVADLIDEGFTTVFADDSRRRAATFTFTADRTVFEHGLRSPGLTQVWNRDVFDEAMEAKNGDKLTLQNEWVFAPVATTRNLDSGTSVTGASTRTLCTYLSRVPFGVGVGGFNKFRVVALGQGPTAPAVTQTALVDEVVAADGFDLDRAARTSSSTESVSPGILLVKTRWTSDSALLDNTSIAEAGVFEELAEATGDLAARYVFGTALKFKATNTFEVEFRVQLSEV